MQTGLYLIVSRNKSFPNRSQTQLNQNMYTLVLFLLFKSVTPGVLFSLRITCLFILVTYYLSKIYLD